MRQQNYILRALMPGLLMAFVFLGGGLAQTKTAAVVPDAQIDANVLKALAGAPELADQAITSTTVYGTVTLKGMVRDEASRDLAEKLVSNAGGVQKVVDELTIGTDAAAGNGDQLAQNSAEEGTNLQLQSDGTMAPAPGPQDQNAAGSAVPQQQNPQGNVPQYPSNGAPQAGQNPPYPSYPSYPPSYPAYRRPYAGAYGQRPYVEQKGGDAVVVPSGSALRVRVTQAMDSRHTAPGTVFDGVVLSDVVAGGFVAIPRGAVVQGRVIDAHSAGELRGKGGLSLELTQVMLGGMTYPLVTSVWAQQGIDKTGNTVGNAVGLGAVGALIGAVAGGGVGAAVGAGVGGVAGLGVSSASRAGEAGIPSEAILNFQLTQPLPLTTVSQAELNRMGSGVPMAAQPQMQRRYYPPPPPPPYYYRPY